MDQQVMAKLGKFAARGLKLQADYEALVSSLEGMEWSHAPAKDRLSQYAAHNRKRLKEDLEGIGRMALGALLKPNEF